MQANKLKILARLGVAITVMATLAVAVAAPALQASAAAPAPTKPIVWADNDHGNAVDGAGNVYFPLGYACNPGAGLALTNKTGTAISGDAKPTTTINVTEETETSNGTTQTSIPACVANGKKIPANYVWVTTGDPLYVLIVQRNTSGTAHDPQFCPVLNNGCTAAIWRLNSQGDTTTLAQRNFTMNVDTSKAAAVDAATPPATGDTDSTDNSPTCEASGFSLNWVLCPIFNGMGTFADWLFANLVQPLLRTAPISTDPADPGYQVWSNFRVFGDIFLIIGLLVVVFGQSIGGGLIDAYTAKKILPRLLIAAILINLSIYIVAFLVDVTNILGGGLGSLMTAPLKGAGAFQISPSGIQQGEIIGGAAAGTGIVVVLLGIGGLIGAIPSMSFILLFLVMPALLGLITAFVTLILRKAILLALVLVSPVAFALYCLPNTEKYFRKWWDFLIQTLLVYPIVIVFFAVADIMAVTVMKANNDANPLPAIIAFLLQFLPLVFIPYAFRLAGGAVGRVHELLTGYHKRGQEAVKGSASNPYSLRNRVRGNSMAKFSRSRAQQYRNLKGGGKVSERLAYLTTFAGDPLAREAEINEGSKRRISQIKDNGDDSIVNARASFLDYGDIDPKTNKPRRKTLDGKSVSDADYRSAMHLYPTLGDMQAVADYRSTKINTTEEADQFTRNFGVMAKQNGLSLDETIGMYTATKFARQHERNDFKYGTYGQDADGNYIYHAVGDTGSFLFDADPANGGKIVDTPGKSRANGFIQENYTKRDSLSGARQFASFYQGMGDVKAVHLGRLQAIADKRQRFEPLNAQDVAMEQDSNDQLKQVLEMQDAYEYSGYAQDPDNPGQMITRAGLSGATAATLAAFNKMKALDNRPEFSPIVSRVKREIADGQTYEATHSFEHGDFSRRPGTALPGGVRPGDEGNNPPSNPPQPPSPPSTPGQNT